MTEPILSPAARYGRMLCRTIRTRRVLQADVARAIGAEQSSVSAWMKGQKLPQIEFCMALAEVLDFEPLLSYALKLRTKTCPIDGREFVDMGKQRKALYCSARCAKTAHARRHREQNADSIKIDRASLAIHREAVGAYCRECEPRGVCQTPECPLRSVSPLPVVGRVKPAEPVERRASDKMLAFVNRRHVA